MVGNHANQIGVLNMERIDTGMDPIEQGMASILDRLLTDSQKAMLKAIKDSKQENNTQV
jgi:hypothetical protein